MRLLVYIILVWSTCSFGSVQTDIDELKKRIEELEGQQEQLLISASEPKPTVSSFLDNDLTLGGFFDTGYIAMAGPDTETQVVNDWNVFGINLAADFGKKFRFQTQFVSILEIPLLNLHNDPNAPTVGLPKSREHNSYTVINSISQGYLEYSFSRKLILQGGIGFVPFGFSLQLREPVLYVRRQGPQLVDYGDLINPFWSGLHLHGSQQMGNNQIGYDLYTFTPIEDSKFIGVGGRTWMSWNDDKYIAGLSSQIGKKESGTFETLGVDFRLETFPYQIRAEFAENFADEGADSWTAYLEPGFYIYKEEVLFYIFGDYYYGANNETGFGSVRIPDPFEKWEYGTGVNWLPTSYTRIRTGITFHDYVGHRSKLNGLERDYTSFDLSVGVAF